MWLIQITKLLREFQMGRGLIETSRKNMTRLSISAW